MKRHMLTHTADNAKDKGRLYPCPFCGVELASKSDVRSHVARDHEQKTNNKTGSESEPSKKKNKAEDGLLVVLPDENCFDQLQDGSQEDSNPVPADPISLPDEMIEGETVVHVCGVCQKTFSDEASLLQHSKTHRSIAIKVPPVVKDNKDHQVCILLLSTYLVHFALFFSILFSVKRAGKRSARRLLSKRIRWCIRESSRTYALYVRLNSVRRITSDGTCLFTLESAHTVATFVTELSPRREI